MKSSIVPRSNEISAQLSSRKSNSPKATSKIPIVETILSIHSRGDPRVTEAKSTSDFVSEFWQETVATFPRDVQEMTTTDQVGYFCRQFELLRRENELLKRDEKERRRSMLLMADKIKLMNQPVVHGQKS
jgi:hypothetical protein